MESSQKLKTTKKLAFGLSLIILLALIVGLFFIQQYLFSSLAFILLTFLPFFIRLESRKVTAREIVILAIMAAIAAVSRVPFAALPSIQPTTFVIIISGIVFGSESGFIIGVMAAFVSNLFLGQGPWTPWQMFAWGFIGLVAGILRNTWILKSIPGKVLFGGLTGIGYGWLLNLWVILSIREFRLPEIIIIYGSSFFFDLLHGLTNIFLLLFFSKSWIKILARFKRKYGILYK